MDKNNFKRTIVTAALPYANGPVHIGHLAGVYVPADIYVRYLRLRGKDVLFVGGSDEHGVPVTIRARQEGCSTQEVVDRYHGIIKKSFEEFGISFDIYSRTTSKTHHQFASDFFKTLYDAGKLTEATTEQSYDPKEDEFLTDKYIIGECPHCGYSPANGSECSKCGASLTPEELISPHSYFGNPFIKRATKHWYLPLQDYQLWLEQWILKNHKEWKENVYGQCKSWLDIGLRPRAVTRDQKWGIPVPVEGAEGKVLYVWFDAPLGYISNTRELCETNPEKWGAWEQWWKDEDTRLLHFIGKDNIVFHCIIFPAMLKAHGGYILPDNVPANEFLNLDGRKISTSQNYAVWLNEYLEELPDRQDELRYVLTVNAPETKDKDFTWQDFQSHCNNELVAVYGNFVNRVLLLAQKYYNGIVPAYGEHSEADREALAEIKVTKDWAEQLLDTFKFREALMEVVNLARIGNRYITEQEPWKVIKTDPDRVKTVINVSLQITAALSVLFEPFIPFSSKRLREYLGIDTCDWEIISKDEIVSAGSQLRTPSLLFRKVEDSEIQHQIEKLAVTVIPGSIVCDRK